MKNYSFEPNGSNAASIAIVNSPGYYMTENNVADAGGSFSLSKFDTVQKKISCNFQLTCYNGDRTNKKMIVSSLTDLRLTMDTSANTGNIMNCTVNGVKTVNWQSKIWTTLLNCGSPGRLDLRFFSMVNSRALCFYIPLAIGAGTYQIMPDVPPYSYCGSNSITARYILDSTYFPTSGSIIITRLDVAQQKLEASFNLNVKDNSPRGDQIEFTKGTIKLNTWQN